MDEIEDGEERRIETIGDCLKVLSQEARELYLSSRVPVLETTPSPLQFYREYVAYNRPVVISGAVKDWPAYSLWKDNSFFRSKYGSKEVTVAVTPNGFADSIVGDRFVMPEERRMKMMDFLDIIEDPGCDGGRDGVFYIQKQNSNLTEEFPELMEHIDPALPWATEAFGKTPDAINFWLGDTRAVTSMHKDPYENIYCVLRGYKDIILQPPTDLPWIPYNTYRPAVYARNEDGNFHIEDLEGDSVPWISIDPLNPDLDQFPEYSNATQIKIRLMAGDALYLPSLWFHHLSQSQGCVAVNFWYDMEFDIKYNYFNLLGNLKAIKDGKRGDSNHKI